MKRSPALMAALTGLILAVSGCGAGFVGSQPEATVTTSSPASKVGGDGLPVQRPGDNYGHQSSSLTGVVALQSNGCWTVDLGDGPRPVVFPTGYIKPPDDGSVMESPNGTRFDHGMSIDATGGIALADGFPGVPDGFWGNYLAYCDSQARELVVLDAVGPAFDPQALTDDQLVEMLGGADLSTSWGCGLGFTISSADQRVALYAYQVDTNGDTYSSVSFPDPAWEAKVMIGKNLLIDNCDDVVEGWEPQADIVAHWSVIAGNLVFTPPAEGACAGGDPVEALLTGAVVETPRGPMELSDLTIVNDAYGCYAG